MGKVPSLISFLLFLPPQKKKKKNLYTLHPEKVFGNPQNPTIMHNKGERELLMIQAQL
jgi:hypothetical protein